MSQKMSEYSAPTTSYYSELIGVSIIDIKSKGDVEAQYFVSKMHCDQFEPRMFETLESNQWESTDLIEIELEDVPCYIEFFKLLREGTCQITLAKSGQFIKTCEYFGATQLAKNVRVYFGRELLRKGKNLVFRIFFIAL